jgi:hypothetical protein
MLTCIHAAEDILDKLPITRPAHLRNSSGRGTTRSAATWPTSPELISGLRGRRHNLEAVAHAAARYLDELSHGRLDDGQNCHDASRFGRVQPCATSQSPEQRPDRD